MQIKDIHQYLWSICRNSYSMGDLRQFRLKMFINICGRSDITVVKNKQKAQYDMDVLSEISVMYP